MTIINVHEAKAKLSEYLRRASNGETIIIAKRNVPIATLGPTQKKKKKERILGLARLQYPDWDGDISAALEPIMTDEEIDEFENNPIFPDEVPT